MMPNKSHLLPLIYQKHLQLCFQPKSSRVNHLADDLTGVVERSAPVFSETLPAVPCPELARHAAR